MTDKVDPGEIETIVGATRDPNFHIGRVVSAEQRVYILHPVSCVAQHEDLRDCFFSRVLDHGIREEDWKEWLDRPVHLGIAAPDDQREVQRLIPLGPITPPVPPLDDGLRKAFNNSLLDDWHDLVERFLEKAEEQQKKHDLTDVQVGQALAVGYGDEIAEAWQDWVDDGVNSAGERH